MTTSADDLIGAFGAEFGVAVTDENRFGSVSLGWLGVCDGADERRQSDEHRDAEPTHGSPSFEVNEAPGSATWPPPLD